MDYSWWNRAIIDYFTEGVPTGISIFLSLDSEALQAIGKAHGLDSNKAEADFMEAIRKRVLCARPKEICLQGLYGYDSDQMPVGVGFLGAMVLAANSMGEDNINETNYFTQFRVCLRIPTTVSGRPKGMSPGGKAEEPLWHTWNQWLLRKGLLTTARQGQGKHKFINYPISQALLRHTDKERIRKHFADNTKEFAQELDPDLLTSKFIACREDFPKHLRDLLKSHADRYQAVESAIWALHSEWLETRQVNPGRNSGKGCVHAGILRYIIGMDKPASYYLLPFARDLRQNEAMQVADKAEDDTWHTLMPDEEHPGFFEPVLELTPNEIITGKHYSVQGSTRYNQLLLPKRLFHLLVSDPDNPDSGVHSTRRSSPGPDIHFILLCSKQLMPDLERLRDARLLHWNNEVQFGVGTNWIELTDCMVLSSEWTYVRLANQELYNALYPRRTITIGLSGGLRSVGRNTYLEQCGPNITFYGTRHEADIRIICLRDEKVVHQTRQEPHETLVIEPEKWKAGGYRIEVATENNTEERVLNIEPWTSLFLSAEQPTYSTPVGSQKLCGAHLIE